MKKAKNTFLSFFSFLIMLAFVFCVGCYFGYTQNKKDESVLVTDTTPDLTLPGETEKRTVTAQEVEGKLVEISEFSTYSYKYKVTDSEEQTRYMLEKLPIWGSTNKISIEANGVVKVGYDFNKITVKVDNDSQKIYISLPEIELLDNYINISSIECTEKNSILNPIEFSQYQTVLTELENLGKKQAEDKGVYKKGEKAIKKYIENFLACFDDYEIIFM